MFLAGREDASPTSKVGRLITPPAREEGALKGGVLWRRPSLTFTCSSAASTLRLFFSKGWELHCEVVGSTADDVAVERAQRQASVDSTGSCFVNLFRSFFAAGLTVLFQNGLT